MLYLLVSSPRYCADTARIVLDICNDGCLRAVDVMIVGMRASVCGYGKDSAFALRDSGAPMFTGKGDEDCASALHGSGALSCLPNVTPSAPCRRTLQGSRRPLLCRATSTSPLWTTIEFAFVGKTCHFDERSQGRPLP